MSQWPAHEGSPVVTALETEHVCVTAPAAHGTLSVSGGKEGGASPPGSDAAGVQVKEGAPAASLPRFSSIRHCVDYLATGNVEHRTEAVAVIRAELDGIAAFVAEPSSRLSSSHGLALQLLGRAAR